MRAGTPGRGASANRSSIPRSLSEMSCKAAQRSRQSRAVSAVTDRCRAISALPCPSFAANTIRARKTSCCALPWRFVSRTNAVCSSSHNVIWVARFGIGFPLLFPFILSHGYLCPRVLGGYNDDEFRQACKYYFSKYNVNVTLGYEAGQLLRSPLL